MCETVNMAGVSISRSIVELCRLQEHACCSRTASDSIAYLKVLGSPNKTYTVEI